MKVTHETREYRKLIRDGVLPRIFPARDKSRDKVIVVKKDSVDTAGNVYKYNIWV